jgi:hypothetical protein
VRKALEGVIRYATHPATFPNAPQRAADPAEEMDAGRPGPECGRPRGAAGRTLRPLRNAGVVAWHVGLPQAASTSVPRNVHDWRGISRLPSAWTATFDCRPVSLPDNPENRVEEVFKGAGVDFHAERRVGELSRSAFD